jgi:uncharacterized membrane protein
MNNMADSMAHAHFGAASTESAGWKVWIGGGLALLMGLFWVVVGGWKITNPYDFAALVTQLKVPSTLSLPFAAILGTAEVFGGLMLLIPRFRRWGALLTALLLVGFMIYMAVNYTELKGADCSCFPWLKRTVSPEFFYGDGLMLLATGLIGYLAAKSTGLRTAAIVLGAVVVFSGVSLGYSVSKQTGTPAPSTIQVAGKPYDIGQGKVFLFFFDPQCMHCFHSAQEMHKYKWADGVKMIVAPVRVPEFAQQFLNDTELHADAVTADGEKLRELFNIKADPPNGVAIEHGRVKASFVAFDASQPSTGLKELGWIQ